ncbi:hypothetical protein B5C34_11005 [Pacificimonas flava]|uniref:Cytochrome b561 bacterial/Ni-hydrogenase domain-containing protein n=2 Tax=Pacificimonas TaxID=1960290 RepID=A0A219B6G0_9SPHN|nr:MULTISPECIES: cytochrome b [Pacificimonas]MBZ6378802.1 cytochrome b [Pacificimonas aurantium]OWV33937.1 hypothetical protein B5C34_11005 [Pacificimonas flava]
MTARYSVLTITLHWLIALLVLFQFVSINILDGMAEGDPRIGTGYMLHKSVGITILVLTLVRIVTRLAEGFRPLPVHMAAWERVLARATHIGFYVFLVLIPLSGWAFAVTDERSLHLFGLFQIPELGLVPRQLWHEVHEQAPALLVILFVLHVLGALKHQFLDRDAILARMLPGAGRG